MDAQSTYDNNTNEFGCTYSNWAIQIMSCLFHIPKITDGCHGEEKLEHTHTHTILLLKMHGALHNKELQNHASAEFHNPFWSPPKSRVTQLVG